MGLQLLQNMEIIKQTDILLWKIGRKYGSVSYLFSCTYSKFNGMQIFPSTVKEFNQG
jgi:hypothetical protein